ncbi:MAG TPA: four helix bundle protein [Ginsengibacter sp.]|nr:four helix bundle protein [Agriterribacter sp.]HRP43254.1 four helix bundle protein [Ginsengibacter sp.]
MKENIIQQKSFAFAIRIVNAYKFLITERKEFVLSKQLLKSGTSIGANVEEASGGQSKKDFIAKISIGYKEARETKYWLRLLTATNYLEGKLAQSLLDDTEELCKILSSILLTSKRNG